MLYPFILLLIAAASQFASAAIVGVPELYTNVLVDSGDPDSGYLLGCTASGTASASAGPCSWTSGPRTYSGSGEARASFDSLGAFASINALAPAMSWVGTGATARSVDYVVFSGGGPAYVQFVYELTGTVTGTGVVSFDASLDFQRLAQVIPTGDQTVISPRIAIQPGV